MKKKSINNILLITLGLIIVSSFININIFNQLNDYLEKNNQNLRENLKSADYSSFIEGSGEDINITIHQSYLNNTYNTNLNISDPNNNAFSIPSPDSNNFNVTDTSIEIMDIFAPNKHLIVEDNLGSSPMIDNVNSHYISFEPRGIGFINNISIRLRKDSAGNTNYSIYLYNATQYSWYARPDSLVHAQPIVQNEPITTPQGVWNWYNFTNINKMYDCSNTYNNLFFLRLFPTEPGYIDCDGSFDSGFQDSVNESIVLDSDLALVYLGGNTIDVGLKLDLIPLNNTPKPSQINLEINNTAVENYNNFENKGIWNLTGQFEVFSKELNFNISADWWDVSCKITKVQSNYTKTDLKANSIFKALETEQDILWNVSRTGGLNYFDSRLNGYRINFTVPSSWNNINVFNGGTDKTEDISISPSKNRYKIVTVSNAGNGTYWHLTANSENLLESIDIYAGSNPINMANYPDVVEFNVTFNKIIGQNDGIINLSVYSPAAINDKLNFTSVNSTFDSGSEFYLGKWELSDTVMEYGEFRVQVFWNNDTAAGFREKILTITGQTDLTLITPSQDATYYSNQSFNIVVYYKDSNQLKAIDGVTIQYNINGQGWQSTSSNNGTIGYYIIPVDCSVFTTEGTKTVEIMANKTYYEGQTLDYNFDAIIVEEKGKQTEEIPLVIIIIAIVSTAAGIGVATVTIVLLRKRKRISKGI